MALPSRAVAQLPFSIDVHDSVVALHEGQFIELKAVVTNISSLPIDVRAIRVSNELPDTLWFTAMCFGDQCYPFEMNETPPAHILPGDTVLFKLSVGSVTDAYGRGQVRTGIRFDTGEFTAALAQTFVVNIDGTSSAPDEGVEYIVSAWPNPATSRLTIPTGNLKTSTSLSVQLIDVMSTVVLNSRDVVVSDDGVSVDVSGLANGTYFYRVADGSSVRLGRIVVAH